MHRLVVRLRALHVRERAHRPAELLLEPQLRDRDLARCLVELEIGERTVADPVRLDAHAEPLELASSLPVEGRVEHAVRGEVLLVRQRLTVADVRERDEQHRRIAVLLQHGHRVLEVVAVAVVERDQHGALRQRLAARRSGRAPRRGRRRCSRARAAAPSARRTATTGIDIRLPGMSLTLWYMSTRRLRPSPLTTPMPLAVSPIAR